MDGCSVAGVHNSHCFPAQRQLFHQLDGVSSYFLQHRRNANSATLERWATKYISYKKTKVNYSMIIITSSIIKNYNSQIWDEPKEYFKHRQAQGKGIIESRQNADLNLLSQTKFLFGLSGKTTEKTMSVFFCSCCDGSSSLSHHLSKRNSNICSLQG